ncbi:MAG: hypothetical protein A2157_02480 [Deltaproteobacteria bacterium RBG_16_47_11]|nr:MAG: hypothetical protein A2157_02480 [Deltaproteobacteria bacterium RBG_16_47_11]
MKYNRLIALILITGMLFMFPSFSFSQERPAGKGVSPVLPPPSEDQKEKPSSQDIESQHKKLTKPVSMPIYVPPRRGAPVGRVGGGTRGIQYELVTLFVLVPDHAGLTVQEQPTLYWYLSKPVHHPVEVTIIEDQAIYPLLETGIPLPTQPGIHPIDLKDYTVSLSLDKQYRWYVAIIPDPDRRSRDIIAGGMIERIEPSENIRTKLAQADKETIPYIYAEAGIWYDALAAISDLIDATPDDAGLRKERSALLEQVGLSEIAD